MAKSYFDSSGEKIDVPETLRLVRPHLPIETLTTLHVILRQLKVKNIQILLEPCKLVGLGDHHRLALNSPAEENLGDGFVVLPGDGLESGVFEGGLGPEGLHVRRSSTERCVCCD